MSVEFAEPIIHATDPIATCEVEYVGFSGPDHTTLVWSGWQVSLATIWDAAKLELELAETMCKFSYWQQSADRVDALLAVRASDTRQQVGHPNLPSSDEKERFLNSLCATFEVEPLESGFDHPSEGIMHEAMQSMMEEHVLEWLWPLSLDPQHPNLAASVLRCLGRLDRPGTMLWRANLICRALEVDEPEIRDAAVQAAESWGGKAVVAVLEAHIEPLPWLDDYIRDVIEDLGE